MHLQNPGRIAEEDIDLHERGWPKWEDFRKEELHVEAN